MRGKTTWLYICNNMKNHATFNNVLFCRFLSVMPPSSPSPQCLQYKTDQAQDVKKIEKLQGKLMRLMVAKETHSGAMETD